MNLRLKLFLLIVSALIFISSANNDGNDKDTDGYHLQGSPAEVNDTRMLAMMKKEETQVI